VDSLKNFYQNEDMKFEFRTRNLLMLGTVCLLFWSYGVLYILPPVREWHNELLFRSKHDATRVEATVIHLGVSRARSKSSSGNTPVLGLRYQTVGVTYFGMVKGNNGVSASEHSDLAHELKGQTLAIWVDAQRPEYFYGQSHARVWTQVLHGGFFYIMVLALTLLVWFSYWHLLQKSRQQEKIQIDLNIIDAKLRKFSNLISVVGITIGVLFLSYKVALTPWMPDKHTFVSLPLSAKEALLGDKWQSWRHVDFRMSGYDSDRQDCDGVGAVDRFSIYLEVRWRPAEGLLANEQIQSIENTTVCKALLDSNQRITLNQTTNDFRKIINGRRETITKNDAYDYSTALLRLSFPRKSVKADTLIYIDLDEQHTVRFPLGLYIW
jgi:hypothetical protein